MNANGELAENTYSNGVKGNVIWSSHTAGYSDAFAYMELDGDFKVYSKDAQPPAGGLGYTLTNGNPSADLKLENSGQFLIVAKDGTTLWRSGSSPWTLADGKTTLTSKSAGVRVDIA